MLVKKKSKISKIIRTRTKSNMSIVTKKVAGSYSYYKSPEQIEREKQERILNKERAEEKKDNFVSKYGEPNHVITRSDEYCNTYYWFDLGYKLCGHQVYRLKLKKKYLLFGEEIVYEQGSNADDPEPHEVQMAYKWFIAERILME